MIESFNPNRYAVIEEKNKREIVMLRGRGCSWSKCSFCDYHLDCSENEEENFELNQNEINKITGIYKKLEVINSGSFVDLDKKTMELIEKTCLSLGIKELHFECHWFHRFEAKRLKEYFFEKGINVKVKTGVETFDYLFRESYLIKGISAKTASEIAEFFDECCLLQGLPGQTVSSMLMDIATGLKHFERVCINIMQENETSIKPDPKIIQLFKQYIYPIYIDNERVDILMENTAFGVGGVTTEKGGSK